jgi:glucan 1,3-beta-glucosidase
MKIIKTLVLTILAIVLCSCTNEGQETQQKKLSFLTSAGTDFVNENGERVILKGCNLGSWLNLEMWMMDIKDEEQYPDQYTIEEVLQERFGKAEKDRIMDLHRENWITERDFEIIKSLGFNCIRVPFHYNIIEDEDNPMHLRKDAWRWFDSIIDLANKYELYVILDLHAAAGNQNLFDHSGRKNWNKLWGDRIYWKRAAWLWEQIAKRYKDCPTIVSYQPINEPWGGTIEQQTELFDYLYQAIRKHDDRHIIIASAHFTGFDHFGDPKDHGWEHVGYSQNFYPGLFGGGSIVPETHKGFLGWLDDELGPKLKSLDIPFLVTEFNVVFDAAGGAEMMRRHYDAYEKHGWAATMWSYKLITSPGRKNTGGWWLITNTGGKKTGAWWIVTNGTALPAVDFNTADKEEIENWFKAFSTVEYEINDPLRDALTATKSPGQIETVETEKMTVAPAADELKGWTAIDINNPLEGGQKVVSKNAVDLYASGSDVYGTEDQFRFVYKKISGDFTLSATVDYLTFTNTYAKAGLMVRQDLDKNSAFATVNIFPDGSIEIGVRPAKGQSVSTRIVMGPELPGIHLKLVRKGNTVTRYIALGSVKWDMLDSVEFESLATDVHAGVYCTSHDNSTLATAKFRDIKVKAN